MHRQFRRLLDSAVGASDYVIVANTDIRGFSAFSTTVESPDSALYIKKVYIQLIDRYYADSTFFKPTGDGLLVVSSCTEDELAERVVREIERSFRILDEFASLVTDDPMITFDVPTSVGIGLARGSASYLRAGRTFLDYSGRRLNLASRLMNVARPSGIVFDESFGYELLPTRLQEKFAMDEIYVPGVAEISPMGIHYSQEYTKIDPRFKIPLREFEWDTVREVRKLKDIKAPFSVFHYPLPQRPVVESEIKVVISFPVPTSSGMKSQTQEGHIDDIGFEYILEAGKPFVILPFQTLAKRLESSGVKDSWEVTIEIHYPIE